MGDACGCICDWNIGDGCDWDARNDDPTADIGCPNPAEDNEDGIGEGMNGLGAGAVRGVCGRSPLGVARPGWGWNAPMPTPTPGEGIGPRERELRLMLRGGNIPAPMPVPMPVGCAAREVGKGLFGLAERPVNGFGFGFGFGSDSLPPFGAVVGREETNCRGRDEFVLGAWSCARSSQRGLFGC